MFAFGWVFFAHQKQVAKVNARRQRWAHFVRHISTIHTREAILSFKSLQLLHAGDVLHKNDDWLNVSVMNLRNALLANLVGFHISKGCHSRRIFPWNLQNFVVSLEVTCHPAFFSIVNRLSWFDIVIESYTVFLLVIKKEVGLNSVNPFLRVVVFKVGTFLFKEQFFALILKDKYCSAEQINDSY